MSIPNGKRIRTPEQQARWYSMHAQSLLSQILHWLDAAANYADLRQAPKPVSPGVVCRHNLADHSRRVRLVPRPPRTLDRLECTMHADNTSVSALEVMVVRALRKAGYTTSEPIQNRCGCITFNVLPKNLAARSS